VPLSHAVFAFGPDFASLQELTTTLETNSGAQKVEIDRDNAIFSFHFWSENGKAAVLGGPPWAILQEPVLAETSNTDARLDAEALFNKEGLVKISDDEAENLTKRLDAVRKATGLVWNQFILRTFDRAVLSGSIVLHARPHRASARFKRLPADVWPVLQVLDWQNGVAVAPEGTAYWSIHVQPAAIATRLTDETPNMGDMEVTDIKATPASAGTTSEQAVQPVRKRGRRLSVSPQVEKKMRADLDEGRLTLRELSQLTRKQLAERYSASAKVVWNARDLILGVKSGNK
jgi:hypothetical protein